MIRTVQVAGLLALAAVWALGTDQKNAPKASPPPKAAPKAGRAPAKGGAPAGGVPKGTRITNPAAPVGRLYRLTPEQRERVLEKLGPQMQARFRENLNWFDSLPPGQQAIVIKRQEYFDGLPPREQAVVRNQFVKLNQLPPDRQVPVRAAIRRLQSVSEADRVVLLNSPGFKNRFTPDELRIIDKVSEMMAPPM